MLQVRELSVAQSCECAAESCRLHVDMPQRAATAKTTEGLIIIVDGCRSGPSPGDVFYQRRTGYRLFRER